MGECGLRGGYIELMNFDSDVKAVFLKMLSARLCSFYFGSDSYGLCGQTSD